MTIQAPERVIIILGMHRSGTSCLTGSLQAAGLQLGEHSTWNLHNKKGNRENASVVELHEQLLEDNQGCWHTPPKKIRWQEQHIESARQLLANHTDEPLWGFKDPRTLLTLNGWEQLIDNRQYIGIFRHPAAVARSINKRGSGIISIDKALDIWYQYNKKLLKAYKRQPFPVLCFDEPESVFHQKLDTVIVKLGLKPNLEERFYSNELVTNSADQNIKLPWRVSRLYKKLQKIAL